jgi:hypothetical protein
MPFQVSTKTPDTQSNLLKSDQLLIGGGIPPMRYCAAGWEAVSIPTFKEYHGGVEACYRLAGEVKTETDRLA